jgi:hypothetical protein
MILSRIIPAFFGVCLGSSSLYEPEREICLIKDIAIWFNLPIAYICGFTRTVIGHQTPVMFPPARLRWSLGSDEEVLIASCRAGREIYSEG